MINGSHIEPPVKRLSRKDTAKLLGVSTQTIYNWEQAGKITPRRTPGGKPFYTEEDVRKIYATLFG